MAQNFSKVTKYVAYNPVTGVYAKTQFHEVKTIPNPVTFEKAWVYACSHEGTRLRNSFPKGYVRNVSPDQIGLNLEPQWTVKEVVITMTVGDEVEDEAHPGLTPFDAKVEHYQTILQNEENREKKYKELRRAQLKAELAALGEH